ncbi:DUF4333 domain-containing protein [Amycolatopsis sp. GM8]|uniref:DUF4333 domain-containing protein n=1 Tax=Amycolatopsis sp. GM8 TaxID=2896530 RepID=UPI001F473E96|nr:DUF4333 domain-containing protein [Amycolatopsis sp. GM8]
MSRRARFWAGSAAGLLLLAGCAGPGGEKPAPSPQSITSGGGTSSSRGLAPVPRVFDPAALESGVRQVLTESYGIADVTQVRCPSGQTVQVGVSFDCAVTLRGEQKAVTLTVRNVDGTYEVSGPK